MLLVTTSLCNFGMFSLNVQRLLSTHDTVDDSSHKRSFVNILKNIQIIGAGAKPILPMIVQVQVCSHDGRLLPDVRDYDSR